MSNELLPPSGLPEETPGTGTDGAAGPVPDASARATGYRTATHERAEKALRRGEELRKSFETLIVKAGELLPPEDTVFKVYLLRALLDLNERLMAVEASAVEAFVREGTP